MTHAALVERAEAIPATARSSPRMRSRSTTAAFAVGEAAPLWTARLRGYEAMTILADGRVLKTPGFPG